MRVCVRAYVFECACVCINIYSCLRVRASKPWHAWSTEGQAVLFTLHVTLVSPVNVKPGLQENFATLPSLSESVNVTKPFCGLVGGDPHCPREQVPSYSFDFESQLIEPMNPELQLHKSPSCLLEFSMVQAVAEKMWCKCTY